MRSIYAGIMAVCALAPAAALAQTEQLQGFNIVLVQGDQQPGNSSDLPLAAQGAIGEMKNFLPFKSYRLVDSAWILSSSPSTSVVTSRLQGPDGQDFEVRIATESQARNNQTVSFRLQEAGRYARSIQRLDAQRQDTERDLATLGRLYEELRQRYTAALKEVEAAASKKGSTERMSRDLEATRAQLLDVERRFEETRARRLRQAAEADPSRRVDILRREVDSERLRLRVVADELKALQQRLSAEHPDVLRQRAQVEEARTNLNQLNIQLQQEVSRVPLTRQPPEEPATQPLIDTTFTMRLGETVVVGTSRVRGDRALIAVLTAVPQLKRE
jgi:hypothetical protein